MPELAETFAAVVKGGIDGALQPLHAERNNYLKYLKERSESTPPENAYQELVELSDRGMMDSDDVVLDELTISGQYEHRLNKVSGMSGDVAVAVGPARVGGSLHGETTEASTSTLQVTAKYRTRPRSDFLQDTMAALPPRPEAAALPAKS
jgi:hypothetical protein